MKKLFAMILIAVLALATVGYAEETSASDNSYNVGDSVYFGHYEQDGDTQNGAEAIEYLRAIYLLRRFPTSGGARPRISSSAGRSR